MSELSKILLIALVLSFITLLTVKIFNALILSKVVIHEINSADSNISSGKIDTIISKLKTYLKASEIDVIYGESEIYSRINQMLNRRKKQINIPKWIMPSVGYELDYIIASIWFNVKLLQKDRDIRKIQLVIKWFPIFLYTIYFLSFITAIVINSLDKASILEANPSGFLFFIFDNPIFEFISLGAFLFVITLQFYSNTLKIRLEEKFEIEIINFVKNECESYKMDIAAARIYSKDFSKLDSKIFRFHTRTSNLKFVGPFTLL